MTSPSAPSPSDNLPLAIAEPLADITLALNAANSGAIPAMMTKLHAGLRANPDSALLLTDEQIGTVSKAYRMASGIALAGIAAKKAPSVTAQQKKMLESGDF